MVSFENKISDLARRTSLKVAEVDATHAKLRFIMNSGLSQTLWILPFGDVWEFSVQSGIQLDSLDKFPQWLLAWLLTQNSKNKRAYWCIETLGGKYVLSAMLNFPASVLDANEFQHVCLALVSEVERLEQAFLGVLADSARVKR